MSRASKCSYCRVALERDERRLCNDCRGACNARQLVLGQESRVDMDRDSAHQNRIAAWARKVEADLAQIESEHKRAIVRRRRT